MFVVGGVLTWGTDLIKSASQFPALALDPIKLRPTVMLSEDKSMPRLTRC